MMVWFAEYDRPVPTVTVSLPVSARVNDVVDDVRYRSPEIPVEPDAPCKPVEPDAPCTPVAPVGPVAPV